MLYVVHVKNKGFIATFDKMKESYTTTLDIDEADYFTSNMDAVLTADYFGGEVLYLKGREL